MRHVSANRVISRHVRFPEAAGQGREAGSRGLEIAAILQGSAAEQAKLQRGDAILSVNGQQIRNRFRRMDDSRFPLLSRGFHWINEQPFNR